MTTDPQIVSTIQEDLDSCREAVYNRLAAENEVTETEVLAIGTEVSTIVREARAHVDDIAEALDGLDADGGLPIVVEEQARDLGVFLTEVRNRLEHFQELTDRAAEKCDRISEIGAQIDLVSMAVRILAISANVEAARLPEGGGFTVIANEMTRLAERIEASNDEVSDVVTHLMQMLPEIGAEAKDLRDKTNQIAERLEQRSEELRRGGEMLSTALDACRIAGERRMPPIVEASKRVVAHLGFQDPVRQRLLRIDAALRLLRVKVMKTLGAGEEVAEDARDKAHVELSLENPADADEEVIDSGELLLF